MQFPDFERSARAVWAAIPEGYREGVDGLIIDRAARPNDDDPDVYTLGECVTEEYPSQYGGPETIRSAVVLYYGSFCEVARDDDAFDWQDEIHQTIMHELQHHLESLATEAGLEDVDYAVNESFKRARGEPFDPLFYRAGESIEAVKAINAIKAIDAINGFGVEGDVFLEIVTRESEALSMDWAWDGSKYRVLLPESHADVTFHYVEEGPDIGMGDFCIVRVLKRGAFATLRSAFGGGYTTAESVVRAEVRS